MSTVQASLGRRELAEGGHRWGSLVLWTRGREQLQGGRGRKTLFTNIFRIGFLRLKSNLLLSRWISSAVGRDSWRRRWSSGEYWSRRICFVASLLFAVFLRDLYLHLLTLFLECKLRSDLSTEMILIKYTKHSYFYFCYWPLTSRWPCWGNVSKLRWLNFGGDI